MAASTISLPSVIPGSLRRRPSKRRLTTSSTRPQPRVNMAVSSSSSSYAAPGAGSSTAATSFKVALLGAAGDVGRPLSLLLKMSPYITSLSLHDPDSSAAFGVAGSLAECNTPCRVSSSPDPIATLRGADLVVMVPPADVDVEDDCDDGSADGWCDAVASAVGLWAAAVADSCPEALVHVVSPAADSVVPMAAEVMRRRGDHDPRRLFGVTTLDAVRASTFAAEMRRDLRLIDVAVPVVGGHGGRTALPLLSKARPATATMWSDRDAAEVTRRVRGAEREVAAARGGGFGCRHHGSALAAAYAAARFVDSSVRASLGEEDHAGWGVCECALVESSVVAGVPYFASRVWLGRDGVEGFVTGDLEGVSPFEAEALEELKPALLHSIERGLDAAARI